MTADMQLAMSFTERHNSASSVCALVARDPSHQRDVDAVVAAVREAARLSLAGQISRNDVAPHIPVWVFSPVIGSTFSGLVSKKVLIWTGRWDTSEDKKGRNDGKPCKIYEFHGERL